MARSATLDMTQGSLGRQIIGFSLPLMFTNLLQMLFSVAFCQEHTALITAFFHKSVNNVGQIRKLFFCYGYVMFVAVAIIA